MAVGGMGWKRQHGFSSTGCLRHSKPVACQACAIAHMLLPACPQAADLKQGLRFKTLQGGEIGIDSAGIEQEEK